MYQALYRKWRPKVFSDVVGQPQVTKTLKNEIQLGRLSHAYLFTGSRGTGKTSCAKILAKAINCLNIQNGDPCGKCEICLGIDNGSILDVVEIDAASNNGVENIRALREEASFTPSSAKFRVYIIDEVHMLSIGAFNALLKILEEPPKHVVFILATTEVHKIPDTILSRCQRFDFHKIDSTSMVERIKYICNQEGKTIDDDAALMISRLSDGALRDALSLLDQCFSKGDHITYSIVENTAGLSGNSHIFSLCEYIITQNNFEALTLISKLNESSKDMEKLLCELLGHFRNLMLFKTINDPSSLVSLSKDEFETLSNQAKKLSLEEIIYIIDSIQNSISRMSLGINKRIETEMCIVKLCSPQLNDTNLSLLDRISKLERAIKSGSINVTNSQNTTSTEIKHTNKNDVVKQAPVSTKEPEKKISNTEQSPTKSIEDIQKDAVKMNDWPEILKVLKNSSRSIATAFNGSVAYVSGNFVLIDAPNSLAFELLRKSAGRDKMRIAIKEITGKTYKLGPYKPQNKEVITDPLDDLVKRAENSDISLTKI